MAVEETGSRLIFNLGTKLRCSAGDVFYLSSCMTPKKQSFSVHFESAKIAATVQTGSFYLKLCGSLIMLRLCYQNKGCVLLMLGAVADAHLFL